MSDYSEMTRLMLDVRDRRCKTAFGKLFDHFAPRLKGFVMRSGMEASAAEDVVQDVMLNLWRKAHLFDPARAEVSGWIYQMTRNRQIDVLRRENRPVPEDLPLPEEVEDAEAATALSQEAAALRQALGSLSPAQREMIERAYLGELSHAEIQTQTGLPMGTIKSRIRLGLEKLRHKLKDTAPR